MSQHDYPIRSTYDLPAAVAERRKQLLEVLTRAVPLPSAEERQQASRELASLTGDIHTKTMEGMELTVPAEGITLHMHEMVQRPLPLRGGMIARGQRLWDWIADVEGLLLLAHYRERTTVPGWTTDRYAVLRPFQGQPHVIASNGQWLGDPRRSHAQVSLFTCPDEVKAQLDAMQPFELPHWARAVSAGAGSSRACPG